MVAAVQTGVDRGQVLRMLLRRRTVMLGVVVIAVLVAAAVFAPLITSYDPMMLSIVNRLQQPGAEHWFGTDEFGRDPFAQDFRLAAWMVGMCPAETILAAAF